MKFMGRHRLQLKGISKDDIEYLLVIDLDNKMYSINDHFLEDCPIVIIELEDWDIILAQIIKANYKEI